MKLIRQPNQWTCGPAAYAMVMGVTLDDVIQAVGHDGSAIVRPKLPDPASRAAFTRDDLAVGALRLGYGLVQFTGHPVYEDTGIKVPSYPEFDQLLQMLQCYAPLVFIIESQRFPTLDHAVAWDGGLTYLDPAVGRLSISKMPPVKYVELLIPLPRKG